MIILMMIIIMIIIKIIIIITIMIIIIVVVIIIAIMILMIKIILITAVVIINRPFQPSLFSSGSIPAKYAKHWLKDEFSTTRLKLRLCFLVAELSQYFKIYPLAI